MGQLSCPLNIGKTINAPDKFAGVYPGNHPTHYPRHMDSKALNDIFYC